MTAAIEYKDIDGCPVSLDKLCRDEPTWSANNIRRLEAERERLREALRSVDGWIERKEPYIARSEIERALSDTKEDSDGE